MQALRFIVSCWANLNLGLSCGRSIMLENIRKEHWLNPLEPAVLPAHSCENLQKGTVFCSDNRYLSPAQNSRSTARWAQAGRTDPPAFEKQTTESILQHKDWGAALSSLNVAFSPCDGLYCIVSCFLFAGSYASWQGLLQSILHFKWSLIMFNHSLFLPCDVALPDSNYLCYYV